MKAKMKPAPVMNTPYWSLNCFVFLVFTTVFQLILIGKKSPCTPFRTMLEVVFLGASLIDHLATYSVYPGRDLHHLFYFDVRNIKKNFFLVAVMHIHRQSAYLIGRQRHVSLSLYLLTKNLK